VKTRKKQKEKQKIKRSEKKKFADTKRNNAARKQKEYAHNFVLTKQIHSTPSKQEKTKQL